MSGHIFHDGKDPDEKWDDDDAPGEPPPRDDDEDEDDSSSNSGPSWGAGFGRTSSDAGM